MNSCQGIFEANREGGTWSVICGSKQHKDFGRLLEIFRTRYYISHNPDKRSTNQSSQCYYGNMTFHVFPALSISKSYVLNYSFLYIFSNQVVKYMT